MSPRSVFRLLIICTILIPFVMPLVAMLPFTTLPAPLLEHLENERSGAAAVFGRLPPSVAVLSGILVIVVLIGAMVGLFTFRRWGRLLYAVMTVGYAACMPLMGPLVLPASLTPLLYISYLAQGAILAMAYLPPISQLYATRKV